ncbi:MAG: hypothetical protein ACKOQ3_05830 [Novosphingobium sp.]
MTPFRTFVRDHRALAGLLVALALLIKALIPAGYMVGTQGRTLSVQVCADPAAPHLTRQIVLPAGGAPHDPLAAAAKSDAVCPFAALAAGTVGAADPVLLLAALGFILLRGFAPAAPPLRTRAAHLRPPLRGPPVPA